MEVESITDGLKFCEGAVVRKAKNQFPWFIRRSFFGFGNTQARCGCLAGELLELLGLESQEGIKKPLVQLGSVNSVIGHGGVLQEQTCLFRGALECFEALLQGRRKFIDMFDGRW